jgi:hypothetical protein
MSRRLLVVGMLLVPALARAGLLGEIETRFRAGQIDEGARHVYRLAALRAPALLPPDLRALPREPDAAAGLTRIAVEAFQWTRLHSDEPSGIVLRDLLLPRPDLPNILDSTTLPIRVSWADPAEAVLAEAVLETAEISWRVESEDYGFRLPPIEPGTERYRIFIDDTGFGGAYTSPYGEDPATVWSDCFTYVVVDPRNGAARVGSTVAHELNHAMQASHDCGEVVTFWENTATYIMSQVFPEALGETVAYMPSFQSQPWRALDYMAEGGSDLSEYGGALFVIYLADTFGGGNGPVFLRRIWEDCEQLDSRNSRDYYTAIAHTVGEAGGPAAMEDVYGRFSEARFFVGEYDDRQHLPGATRYPSVGATAWLSAADLPVTDARPLEEHRPAPYGANYVVVELAHVGFPLRLSFDGLDETRWAVRLLTDGDGPTEGQELALDPLSQSGSVVVDPTGRRRLVVVVANLGAPDYSPNQRTWPVAEYVYSIEPIIPPPSVTGARPETVTRGEDGVRLELLGEGFVGGRGFAVAFDDPAVKVLTVLGVTPGVVTIVVDVPPAAAIGPKLVTVTNSGGAQATGPSITVVDPPADGSHGEPAGGGCRVAGSWPCTGLPASLLALLARRRRRRR